MKPEKHAQNPSKRRVSYPGSMHGTSPLGWTQVSTPQASRFVTATSRRRPSCDDVTAQTADVSGLTAGRSVSTGGATSGREESTVAVRCSREELCRHRISADTAGQQLVKKNIAASHIKSSLENDVIHHIPPAMVCKIRYSNAFCIIFSPQCSQP